MIVGREGSSTSFDRERGFIDGLRECGRHLFGRAVGNYTFEGASAAARQLLDRPPRQRPDGVFAASDVMAVAAMEVARSAFGIRIPEELSVIGYDDIPMAALSSYSLTTFHLPLRRMIEVTVRVLIEQIESGEMTPQKITIAGHMVDRGSVARRI